MYRYVYTYMQRYISIKVKAIRRIKKELSKREDNVYVLVECVVWGISSTR